MVGVDRFTHYSGCLKCSARIKVDVDDKEVGECTKCKMIQCMDDCKCSISAQLAVKTNDSIMTLRAFDEVVYNIAQKRSSENVSAKMLVKAKPFATYHRNGIIQSISCDI